MQDPGTGRLQGHLALEDWLAPHEPHWRLQGKDSERAPLARRQGGAGAAEKMAGDTERGVRV